DIHQHHIGAHSFEAIQESAQVANVLMLDDDTEWQPCQAGLRLLQQFPMFNGQSDRQGVHGASRRSAITFLPKWLTGPKTEAGWSARDSWAARPAASPAVERVSSEAETAGPPSAPEPIVRRAPSPPAAGPAPARLPARPVAASQSCCSAS